MRPCPVCGTGIAPGLVWAHPGVNCIFVDGLPVPIRPVHGTIVYEILKQAQLHVAGQAETAVIFDNDLVLRVWGNSKHFAHSPRYLWDRITAIRRDCRKKAGRQVVERFRSRQYHEGGYYIPLQTDRRDRCLTSS